MAVAGESDRADTLGAVLRPVIGLLANVTVITALLVYFGWRRAATQSDRLGLSEAVFGMTTQDYVLRSVGPVLVLLVAVGVVALLWVALDRWLYPQVLSARKSGVPLRPAARWTLRAATVAWLALPLAVWLLGFVWRAAAYLLLPVSVGVGVLLLLYAAHLGGIDVAGDEHSSRRVQVLRAAGLLMAVVCTFWAANNYAHWEGVQLAARIDADVSRLPGVVLVSAAPLALEGPGIRSEQLPAVPDGTAGPEGPEGPEEQAPVRHRYEGLRLLEYTRGTYFLVSDGWTREEGAVLVLPEGQAGVQVQFVKADR